MKQVLRRINRNSVADASIESGAYTVHYKVAGDVVYMTVTDRSFSRDVVFAFLADLAAQFSTAYPPQQVFSPTLRPYNFVAFEGAIEAARKRFADMRAAQSLDVLNSELRDVTKVMTKNIEDLLYRGDSLERMGELSSRLRDDSKKYRRAAVKINWDLLLKQYGPFAALGFIILVFLMWRFW